MDQKRLSDNDAENEADLQQKVLETLYRIEEKLEYVAAGVDRNTSRLNLMQESLPDIPVHPVLTSELRYDHKTKTLWADDRYYIEFDGKQAELLSLLFLKSGRLKKSRLQIDDLVERSYDHATNKYTKPRTVYLRGLEIQKKIEKDFRTPNLFEVTLKEIYFVQK